MKSGGENKVVCVATDYSAHYELEREKTHFFSSHLECVETLNQSGVVFSSEVSDRDSYKVLDTDSMATWLNDLAPYPWHQVIYQASLWSLKKHLLERVADTLKKQPENIPAQVEFVVVSSRARDADVNIRGYFDRVEVKISQRPEDARMSSTKWF